MCLRAGVRVRGCVLDNVLDHRVGVQHPDVIRKSPCDSEAARKFSLPGGTIWKPEQPNHFTSIAHNMHSRVGPHWSSLFNLNFVGESMTAVLV